MGNVDIHSSLPHTMHIHAEDHSQIHWNEFSIGLDELVKFIQPSNDSLVINRVIGSAMSSILGRLESNGSVFLINQNGILIGENAIIDTSQFLASTLDMPNSEELLFKGDSKATIMNYGTIKAWDGDITLISCHVENHGTLDASGVVSLAAGREVLLKPDGKSRGSLSALEMHMK